MSMYVFLGIHFLMLAIWLLKSSGLFQFCVGFTMCLKFENAQPWALIDGRQGIILNSMETTAESNESICVARASGRVHYKLEFAHDWQKKYYPHCRKLCFSPMEWVFLCILRLPPPVLHILTRTGADLTAASADSAHAWIDLGLPFAYVCLHVCMYVCILHKRVRGRPKLAPRQIMFWRSPWRKVGPRQYVCRHHMYVCMYEGMYTCTYPQAPSDGCHICA